MRKKTAILLLVFLSSLIPFSPVKAGPTIKHSIDDAIALMYISDAILWNEEFPEEVFLSPGLLSPESSDPHLDPDNAALAGALHAAKALRNDLDAICALLTTRYRKAGKKCEADLIQATCNEKKAEINAEIGMLHDKRGNRRRTVTKIVHFFKRQGRGVWHKIGPLGRNFLRRVGPEALQMVATGGFGSGVFKNLLKHTAKSMARERIKQVVFQGVQRLLQGQIEIAHAAGVDICAEEEEEVTTTENKNGSDDCSTNNKWLDEFWDGAVVPRLVEDGKNCQPKAAWKYRSCLQDQAASGVCLEQAIDACHAHYEAIPLNDSGGTVSLSPTIQHGGAKSVSTSLTYPSEGGAVNGQFFYTLYDSVNLCTVTVNSTVVGIYDLTTCTMSGTAQLKAVYDGYACPGVCGPSTGACPKTLQGEVPWEAELEDGELSGGVDIGDCTICGFGFWASP